MKIKEYLPESKSNFTETAQLDELNWKDVKRGVGAAALSGAIASTAIGPGDLQDRQDGTDNIPTVTHSSVEKKQDDNFSQENPEYTPLTNHKNERILANTAQKHGIVGVELAAFMSQMAHESMNFSDMVENNPDIKKYSAGRVAKMLGNRNKNDAERFVGRGFIQLTGRWNYNWMQKELGIDLTSTWSNAHKAAQPEIAAEIAVAYWKKRVQPRVDDYTDVPAVTKPINQSLNGLNDRQNKFLTIVRHMDLDL